MAKTEAKLSACMLVQQFDIKHFSGWTDEELKYIENRNTQGIAHTLMNKAMKAGYAIEELHIIEHNQDSREVWNEAENQYVVDLKPDHFHALMKFWKNPDDGKLASGTLPQLASAFGVEPQYIEKPERGRYAYDNMLSYLIHAKDAGKYQYKPDDVYSTGLMKDKKPIFKTYPEYYAERKKEWEIGRAKKRAKQAKIDIDSLEEQILLGEVTENQILLTDEYFDVYARNKRRCDDAFDTFARRKIAKTIQAMDRGDFKVTVYYITGRSHAGKSTFTDMLVKGIQAEAREKFGNDWTVCSTASSNPFDEYKGDEILVMDDLRGMALTASDWLKLMDPDRIGVGSARYHNKKIAARVIIINSEKDVADFFYYIKGNGTDHKAEALDQFFRRIMARVRVYRVPDNYDVRKIQVGEMQELPAGKFNEVLDPNGGYWNGSPNKIRLRHDFNKNLQDMDVDEAVAYLADIVIKQNSLNKESEV